MPNMMLKVYRRRRARLWRMIMSMRKSEDIGTRASVPGGSRSHDRDLSEMEFI